MRTLARREGKGSSNRSTRYNALRHPSLQHWAGNPWLVLCVSLLVALALPTVANATTVQVLPPPAGESEPPKTGPAPSSQLIHHLPMHTTGESLNVPLSGAEPLVAGGPGQKLGYHGGTVQYAPELDLLFWGNRFWSKELYPVGLGEYLKSFYHGLETESVWPSLQKGWQGILSQYDDANEKGQHQDAKVVKEADVNAIQAPKNVTEELIKEEIDLWVSNGLTQNKNTQVVVLTAPGTTFSQNVACGYHALDHQGYSYSLVVWAPDVETKTTTCLANELPECEGSERPPKCETKSERQGKIYNESTGIASHEFAESVTDPLIGGKCSWIENCETNSEIADLCNTGAQELPGDSWFVNPLWDDEGGNKCSVEDPPYPEPPAPAVTTETATGIQYKQATLNGSVNPNGLATTYYFEWGLSNASEHKTSEKGAGYGASSVAESETITGLKPGTTYHIRIVASSWAGKTTGGELAFTTPIPPPVVTTEGPTEIGEVHATLNALVNPEEFSTTYQFEYWPRGKGSEAQKIPVPAGSAGSGASNVSVNQKLSGLPHNTEFVYRVIATNGGGTTNGQEASFITGPFLEYHATLNPSGAEKAILHGMSCTSSSWCMGVGTDKVSGAEALFGESWNGSEWKLNTPAMPSGAKEPDLESVSCTSSAACTAVGWYLTSSGSIEPLAERWNGTSWTIQPTPGAPSKDYYALGGVDCTSSTACIAVGQNVTGVLESMTLAESWNGTEWKVVTTPGKGSLGGISCTSSSACTAVGGTGFSGEPLAERWNGTEWSTQKTAKISSASLSGVACMSTTSCIAVGSSGGTLGAPSASISEKLERHGMVNGVCAGPIRCEGKHSARSILQFNDSVYRGRYLGRTDRIPNGAR